MQIYMTAEAQVVEPVFELEQALPEKQFFVLQKMRS